MAGSECAQFQSRNRETYDSNLWEQFASDDDKRSFNLVIEKLMIPTIGDNADEWIISEFQSRNRETYDFN